MNAVVFLSGIHDPKWPLEWSAPNGLPVRRPDRFLLSPFDEAALELLLRLRDRHAVTVRAVVVGAEETEKLARVVAAYNLPVSTLQMQAETLFDGRSLGGAVAALVEPSDDIVLMGREFGDLDDGALGAWLSSRLSRPFFALAQDVSLEDGELAFVRERGEAEEALIVRDPVLVSVTNARCNRLRRPLIKNVMAARQAYIPNLVRADPDRPADVALLAAAVAQTGRGGARGRILAGPVHEQAAEMAALLAEAGDAR